MANFLSAAMAALLASVNPRQYQRVKPITNKNIGRNLLRYSSKYMPHQSERECSRRRRQEQK